MAANQLIIVEIVTAIEILCRQVNTMITITGRQCPNDKLQLLINARVEEFKMLYPEIPSASEFTVESLQEGLLFISSNLAFREYAQENEQYMQPVLEDFTPMELNNTLH